MGISIKTLLEHEFFKDFHIVAGSKGIQKEVQGIAVICSGCLSLDERKGTCNYFRLFYFDGTGLYQKVF